MPALDNYESTKYLVLNVALLACAGAVGFYVIGKIRSGFRQSDPGASRLLDNFRDLHDGGELSDEEYRNIKAKLASQLREEMKEAERKKAATSEKAGGAS